MAAASTSVNGYLTSTDWNTFNGKTRNLGTVTGVTGTAPVSSTGGTAPVISMAAASTSVNGYLTSTDWNTFNGKQAALSTASASVSGILSSTDWSTFNGKQASGSYVTVGGALGTPSSGTLTNCTFPTLNQSTSGSAGTFTSTTQNSQFNSIGVGTAASTTAGEIRATNDITAYYSDDKLKTKLGNITNALEKVKSLNGFYYEANQTAQDLGYKVKREVGLSAQQVQKILPEIVVPAPISDKYLTIHYDRVIPLLVEAIKELEEQVRDLKSKLP
jgi:hypothetical protein